MGKCWNLYCAICLNGNVKCSANERAHEQGKSEPQQSPPAHGHQHRDYRGQFKYWVETRLPPFIAKRRAAVMRCLQTNAHSRNL